MQHSTRPQRSGTAMAKRKLRKYAQPYEAGDLPTPEQIMHGDAIRDFVTHAETATKAMAHRVVTDPVEKWRRKGKLTPTEDVTISRMQEVWDRVHGQLSITGAYSEPSGGMNSAFGGLTPSERQIALRDALRAVEDEFKGLRPWYSIFERVCRFGEHPLDVAGNRDKALYVVKFVASIIAAKKLI